MINSNIPYNYPLCLNRQCPKASTCLRQMAEQEMGDDVKWWVIVSPRHLSALEGDCPYYRSSVKVRFAKGFIALLDSLPHRQMQIIISNLVAHFGRRTYYRVRKGERLLSPGEQQEMLNILKKHGVTAPKEFDAYVEDYDW